MIQPRPSHPFSLTSKDIGARHRSGSAAPDPARSFAAFPTRLIASPAQRLKRVLAGCFKIERWCRMVEPTVSIGLAGGEMSPAVPISALHAAVNGVSGNQHHVRKSKVEQAEEKSAKVIAVGQLRAD